GRGEEDFGGALERGQRHRGCVDHHDPGVRPDGRLGLRGRRAVRLAMADASTQVKDFARVETWVFDLDNTLYPHHLNLWHQVDARIRDFIAVFLQVGPEEAFRVQKDYY